MYLVGLGPSGSNAGDVSGFNATPTFVETLVADGIINAPSFGIFISPLGQSGVPEGEGEITFGGVDSSRIKGDYCSHADVLHPLQLISWLSGEISWIPQNPPVDFHWEFNASTIRIRY